MLNQNWALCLIEEFSEFERHFGRDAAPTENDFVDASWADAKGSRKGVLGNAHGHEIVFEQNFTGCDGGFHREFLSTDFADFHRFQVFKIFHEELGAPTSSLAEEGVDAEEDLGGPALDQGQSSASWHKPALTGFWWI